MSVDKIVPSAIAKAAEQRGVKRRRFVCFDCGARGKFYTIDEERLAEHSSRPSSLVAGARLCIGLLSSGSAHP